MINFNSKKIGIVFPYKWAKFSPSFYNFINLISEKNTIHLITFDQDLSFLKKKNKIILNKVNYTNNFLFDFFEKIFYKFNFEFAFKDFFFIQKVKKFSKNKFDILVLFDPISFFAIKKTNSYIVFYSLELIYGDKYFYYLKKNRNLIDTAITQSKERYDFYFQKSKVPYNIVHNSPYYKKVNNSPLNQRNNYVFFGSFINQFGSHHLIKYFKNMKEKLYISNINKIKNIDYENIIIEESYISENDISNYLSKFKIGFSFFDLNQIVDSMKFNFETGPSGKIYNYFLAGTPLICNNIKAFHIIEEFKCGVLINDFSSYSIELALKKILNNYDYYQKGCLEASKFYDYKKCTKYLKKIF